MPDDLIAALHAAITDIETREHAKVRIGLTKPSPLLTLSAAHRKIVKRHSLRGKSILRNGEFLDHCAACQQPIPCPDLRDLAEGYGLIEELGDGYA